jgi:hypothetical protein
MKKRIRLTEGQLHRIVRQCVNEALNEIGDTFNPIKSDDAVRDEWLNKDLTDKQKEYAFARKCEAEALAQGRTRQAATFRNRAVEIWNKYFGFNNPNAEDGEMEDFHMKDNDSGRKPFVDFSFKGKPSSDINQKAAYRNKIDKGMTARGVAPIYNRDTGKVEYFDGTSY